MNDSERNRILPNRPSIKFSQSASIPKPKPTHSISVSSDSLSPNFFYGVTPPLNQLHINKTPIRSSIRKRNDKLKKPNEEDQHQNNKLTNKLSQPDSFDALMHSRDTFFSSISNSNPNEVDPDLIKVDGDHNDTDHDDFDDNDDRDLSDWDRFIKGRTLAKQIGLQSHMQKTVNYQPSHQQQHQRYHRTQFDTPSHFRSHTATVSSSSSSGPSNALSDSASTPSTSTSTPIFTSTSLSHRVESVGRDRHGNYRSQTGKRLAQLLRKSVEFDGDELKEENEGEKNVEEKQNHNEIQQSEGKNESRISIPHPPSVALSSSIVPPLPISQQFRRVSLPSSPTSRRPRTSPDFRLMAPQSARLSSSVTITTPSKNRSLAPLFPMSSAFRATTPPSSSSSTSSASTTPSSSSSASTSTSSGGGGTKTSSSLRGVLSRWKDLNPSVKTSFGLESQLYSVTSHCESFYQSFLQLTLSLFWTKCLDTCVPPTIEKQNQFIRLIFKGLKTGKFNVKQQGLGKQSIKYIILILKKKIIPEHLVLASNPNSLTTPHYFTSLNLSTNQLSNEGLKMLCEDYLMSGPPCLMKLDLSNNNITDEGLSCLFDCLSDTKNGREVAKIKELNLSSSHYHSNMYIGPSLSASKSLSSCLLHNNSILRLNLSNTGLGLIHGAISYLAYGLSKNKTLEWLDLSENYLLEKHVCIWVQYMTKDVAGMAQMYEDEKPMKEHQQLQQMSPRQHHRMSSELQAGRRKQCHISRSNYSSSLKSCTILPV